MWPSRDALSRGFALQGGATVAAITVLVAVLATIMLPLYRETPFHATSRALMGCAAALLPVARVFEVSTERARGSPVHRLRREVAQSVLYVVALAAAWRAADVSIIALQETLGNLATWRRRKYTRLRRVPGSTGLSCHRGRSCSRTGTQGVKVLDRAPPFL